MGKPRRYGFFQGKFSATVLGSWSSTPKRWASTFSVAEKNAGETRRRLGPGWMLSFQDSHCQPWISGIRKSQPLKRNLWFNMRCCRSFMLRPQGYQGHPNTETPSASRSPWRQRCFQWGSCCELRKHDLIDPDEICGMSHCLCAEKESGSGRSSFQ